MVGLTKFIAAIGDDNMSVQALDECMTECMTNVSQYKKSVSKITFETEEINVTHVVTGTGKKGLIIWCDQQAYFDALNKIKEI
ncbi:hypothetical protein [Providencia stuartii]|uniref:hypothetical protein n=1 Tax=Providencia stuartii TaxID=588 RepID=UPI0011210325|nr:hypothetical protein [Providencia stuartii]